MLKTMQIGAVRPERGLLSKNRPLNLEEDHKRNVAAYENVAN